MKSGRNRLMSRSPIGRRWIPSAVLGQRIRIGLRKEEEKTIKQTSFKKKDETFVSLSVAVGAALESIAGGGRPISSRHLGASIL